MVSIPHEHFDVRWAAVLAGQLAGCHVRWHGGSLDTLPCGRHAVAFLACALFELGCNKSEIVEVVYLRTHDAMTYRVWGSNISLAATDDAARSLTASRLFAGYTASADGGALILALPPAAS